ncbi:ATP-binding protein [Coleofasciculus sp. FACHB-T130]|uniref:ATP-binding protein n=1 Tax=Cyanophyceae TaxID=3028117 RepID=UPI0016874255|nr:ATP-binding protein [Coleofasciculus sp. FACHB-T130]MBD1878386.1 putative DNA binding domain-containing protein [Coleofasciculus sp. FACHB-T130]
MDKTKLVALLKELTLLPGETEWVEFKHNNGEPEMIGEYISALSNSAVLNNRQMSYLVWGVEDNTHKIVGTSFKPHQTRINGQELQNWLMTQLNPRIDFTIHEFKYGAKNIVIFEISRANHIPIQFKNNEYVRIGSYKQLLKKYPEKERKLWELFSHQPFEKRIALENVPEDEVLSYLNYSAYFDLTKQKLPENRLGILERFTTERFIVKKPGGCYDITNFGALLFAKDLKLFERLYRKAIRVIIYKGKGRTATQREETNYKGYAIAYEEIIKFINDYLPKNEHIGQALRQEVQMYPEIAIRELVANAMIHQDLNMSGTSPMIEIFSDRMEITSPGEPLIDPLRFIDAPPRSRNEDIASFLRRINVCEERGSGIDKVIYAVELFQLPAPEFTVVEQYTKVILFAHKEFAQMTKEDRVRACYQHSCLRYVFNEQMTNSSLQQRFGKHTSMVSRIIRQTLEDELIKPYNPENESRKHAKYVPFWA